MNDMEAMIYHFKQVMEGVKAPVGEAYVGIETRRASSGPTWCRTALRNPCGGASGRPRSSTSRPSPRWRRGTLLSDLIAINASVDIVMGEVDR